MTRPSSKADAPQAPLERAYRRLLSGEIAPGHQVTEREQSRSAEFMATLPQSCRPSPAAVGVNKGALVQQRVRAAAEHVAKRVTGVGAFVDIELIRPALLTRWKAVQATGKVVDGRQALLGVAWQMHEEHPEHSVTAIRKAGIAWLGFDKHMVAGAAQASTSGVLLTLVKVTGNGNSLAVYAVDSAQLARHFRGVGEGCMLANGRKIAVRADDGVWINARNGQLVSEPKVLRRYELMKLLKV